MFSDLSSEAIETICLLGRIYVYFDRLAEDMEPIVEVIDKKNPYHEDITERHYELRECSIKIFREWHNQAIMSRCKEVESNKKEFRKIVEKYYPKYHAWVGKQFLELQKYYTKYYVGIGRNFIELQKGSESIEKDKTYKKSLKILNMIDEASIKIDVFTTELFDIFPLSAKDILDMPQFPCDGRFIGVKR